MDIQLSRTQMDLVFGVFFGTPIAKSTSVSLSLGARVLTCVTIGDVCAVQTSLKAAKILGYSDRIIGQINTKIDRALVLQGQKNSKAQAA